MIFDLDELRAFLKGDPKTGEIEQGEVNPLINAIGDDLDARKAVPYADVLAIEYLTDEELHTLAWSCEQYPSGVAGAPYANAALMVAISCAVELANRLADAKG